MSDERLEEIERRARAIDSRVAEDALWLLQRVRALERENECLEQALHDAREQSQRHAVSHKHEMQARSREYERVIQAMAEIDATRPRVIQVSVTPEQAEELKRAAAHEVKRPAEFGEGDG